MPYREWTFEIEGSSHTVELELGTKEGERTIRFDGREHGETRTFLDIGSKHLFETDGHSYLLYRRADGPNFRYDLEVEGDSIGAGLVAPSRGGSRGSSGIRYSTPGYTSIRVCLQCVYFTR